MSEIKVNTKYNDDMIIQTVDWGIYSLRNGIVEHTIKLRDQGVREALVMLGWTPPSDDIKATI